MISEKWGGYSPPSPPCSAALGQLLEAPCPWRGACQDHIPWLECDKPSRNGNCTSVVLL